MLLLRSLWFSLPLLCCACELIVDFPEVRDDSGATEDASADAAGEMDADAKPPAIDATGDERPSEVGRSDAQENLGIEASVISPPSEPDGALETDAATVEDAAAVADAGADADADADATVVADAAVQADGAVDASSMRCDATKPVGSNGCPATASFCKVDANGVASCSSCLVNADCAADPLRPVCDVASASCRAVTASDCVGATPMLVNGRCAECTSDVSCAGKVGRPYCDASNQCVSCAVFPAAGCIERSLATQFCNVTTGSCVRCLQNTDCSALLTPSATPICLNSVCVACSATGIPNPDSLCSMGIGGPICVLSGPEAGRCGSAP